MDSKRRRSDSPVPDARFDEASMAVLAQNEVKQVIHQQALPSIVSEVNSQFQLLILEASRYSTWERDFKFRVDLHAFLPDAQLLPFVGLSGGSIIRAHAMKFGSDAEQKLADRNLKNFRKVLDLLYEMTSKERTLLDMDKLFELGRLRSESIQSFWNRFDTALMRIDNYDTMLTDDVLFLRALKALQLTFQQRTAVLGLIVCHGGHHGLTQLRNSPTQLLGLYRSSDCGKEDRQTMITESSHEKSTVSCSPSSEVPSNEDEIWLVKKGVRRPGLEKSALSTTQRNINFQNDGSGVTKSPGSCDKCGSKEHLLRACSRPHTPVLAFAPSGYSSSIPKANSDHCEHPDLVPETGENHNQVEEAALTSGSWAASWLQEVEDIMTCSTSDYTVNVSGEVSMPNGSDEYASDAIIDCGDTSSVAGMKWMRIWFQQPEDQLVKLLKGSKRNSDLGYFLPILMAFRALSSVI